ncbi:MAG TPA: inositol monophosphatase family protein [Syntrophobacteraceae bacterium]|nr:inositol monophosphatase family protein [Syntrophobacteraceae bacterium]
MVQLEKPAVEDLTKFAVEMVRTVGDEALAYYGKGNPEVKFDEELVTAAELHLVELFRGKLHERFPQHGLFGDDLPSKDYVHGQEGYLWILDALDGVANFQAGVPIWGTSLALLENFWPILGVFYMPVTGDLYSARAGQKAFWGQEPIRIPNVGDLSNESLLLTYSRFHNHYHSVFPGKIRNLGSTAAHICYVARGRAEAALLAHVSYQDLAAAQIILAAAGGEIRKLDGSAFHLSEYLGGSRIEEHLLAAPKGAHSSIAMYLEELG